MAGKKGKSGGANNTRLQRGEKKENTMITLAPTDKIEAKKLFGSISKAVEWAIEHKKALTNV